MIKIALIREGKNPPDERVCLTPQQCVQIMRDYPAMQVVVQSSKVRRIPDEAYSNAGIRVVEEVGHCDILLGVKEVPKSDLIPGKTYFFFSHTIKKQAQNRALLQSIVAKQIRLIDWECLVNAEGNRIIGFGKYAGIVGAYNAFKLWGEKYSAFHMKKAHDCADMKEVQQELKRVHIPNIKIVITGGGRVASGILIILKELGISAVSPQDFLQQDFNKPVYTQLSCTDYAQRKDGSKAVAEDYYQNPELFETAFYPYAQQADVLITGHFWDSKAPMILPAAHFEMGVNLKVIADVSCDIDGPIASTLRASTIAEPFYGYQPITRKEVDFKEKTAIGVMAVDNLPCELPVDASADFGNEIIKHVIPAIQNDDETHVLERATITQNGALKPRFAYLQEYVFGDLINK